MRTLDKVLTEKQRNAGFCLEEPDDHTLELKLGDKIIAQFTSNATRETIRLVAKNVLRRMPK